MADAVEDGIYDIGLEMIKENLDVEIKEIDKI